MSLEIVSIFSVLLGVGGTVLLCIFFLPEKKGTTLTGFGAWLHNLLNFKELLLERILKVLYILSSVSCITFGFFALFAREGYGGYTYAPISVGLALCIMIFGPVLIRVLYEVMMMFVLLVTNVITIRKKICDSQLDAPAAAPKPVAPQTAPVQPRIGYCTQCGNKFDLNQGYCPQCGKKVL